MQYVRFTVGNVAIIAARREAVKKIIAYVAIVVAVLVLLALCSEYGASKEQHVYDTTPSLAWGSSK